MASTQGNSLSVFSLLDALRRRKFILVATTILLTGGFAAFARMQPDKYRATALIAAAQTTPPEYLRSVAPPALNIEDHLWTVREVLFSEPVLEAAAKQSTKYQGVQGKLTPQQLDEFKQAIGIKVADEHSFQLTYDTGERHDAMEVTNKLAELFVGTASAKREQKTSEAATVIDDQLNALKKNIEVKSKEMHDYKTKAVHALPDHLDDNLKGIDSARDQIQMRDTKIAEEESRRTSIQKELQDLESKGVLDQPLIREKTADETKLEELRFQLNELMTKYTAEHPLVVAMKRQIGDLEKSTHRSRRRAEPSRVPAICTIHSSNRSWKALTSASRLISRNSRLSQRKWTDTAICSNPLLNTKR